MLKVLADGGAGSKDCVVSETRRFGVALSTTGDIMLSKMSIIFSNDECCSRCDTHAVGGGLCLVVIAISSHGLGYSRVEDSVTYRSIRFDLGYGILVVVTIDRSW
jgi:hypothetical protein